MPTTNKFRKNIKWRIYSFYVETRFSQIFHCFFYLEITCRITRPSGENSAMIHGYSTGTYNYGDEIYYYCKKGYKLNGPETRRCVRSTGTSGKWTGHPPQCTSNY